MYEKINFFDVAFLFFYFYNYEMAFMQPGGVKGHLLSLTGTFSARVLSLLIAHGTNPLCLWTIIKKIALGDADKMKDSNKVQLYGYGS